jgi:hypothetical protein
MPDDIIAEIDRLHAEATPGPWTGKYYSGAGCEIRAHVDVPKGGAAEIAAHQDSDGMTIFYAPWSRFTTQAYESGVLANTQLAAALRNAWPAIRDRLRESERKAKAFDLIANGTVGIVGEPTEDGKGHFWLATLRRTYKWHRSPDLLTAIETALRGEEQSK